MDVLQEKLKKDTETALAKIKESEKYLDKIRGSLIGGAAGDALGYAIEFADEGFIFSRYGEDGITEYDLDSLSGKAPNMTYAYNSSKRDGSMAVIATDTQEGYLTDISLKPSV